MPLRIWDFARVQFENISGTLMPRRQKVRIEGMAAEDTGDEIILYGTGNISNALATAVATPGGIGEVRKVDLGGGDTFEIICLSGTATVDNITVFASSADRHWALVWDGITLHGGSVGLRCDGVELTDAVVSGTTLTSATAGFSAADVGKKIKIRVPSAPATGTVALNTASNYITGTGTAFLSEIDYATDPTTAIAVCIDGHYYGLANPPATDTQIPLAELGHVTGSGYTLYRTTEHVTTIAAYVSATEVTLADASPGSGSGLMAWYGTDEGALFVSSVQAAIDAGAKRYVIPPGMLTVAQNCGWDSVSDFEIVADDVRLADLGPLPEVRAGYAGLLSFTNSDHIRLYGNRFSPDGLLPCGGLATYATRKGLFFRTCGNVHWRGFTSSRHGTAGEYYYGDASSAVDGWIIEDVVFDPTAAASTNGININSSNIASLEFKGKIAAYSWQNAISVATKRFKFDAFTCGGPDSGGASAKQSCQDSCVVDCATSVQGGKIKFENIAHFTGVGCMSVFGTATTGVSQTYEQLEFVGPSIYPAAYSGGLIQFQDFRGVARIGSVTVDGVACYATGGKVVKVTGACTGGDIRVLSGTCRGNSGANMTIGVEVDSTVDDGVVSVADEFRCLGTITQRWKTNGKKLKSERDDGSKQTISATGTTAVGEGVAMVLVTANGAVTCTLWDPTLVPGKRVTVFNKSTQLGTTTIGTAAGAIEGTTSLVGASQFATYESDGTNWLQVA